MANIVSVNVASQTVGSEGTIKNFFFGTKNVTKYSPVVVRGFDTNDFVGPVTNTGGVTYFTTRQDSNSDNQSKKDFHIDWTSADTLLAIQSQSSDLVILTGLFRDSVRQVPLNSQKMIFDVNKMTTGSGLIPDPVSGGTIFNYVEEGNNLPMQYTVAETIAYIAASTAPTPHAFAGYELYVNDIQGNDSTAQFGDPLSPWKTFDAAMTAAQTKAFATNIIITGGSQNSTNNAYAGGVNITIEPDATLTINSYTATGAGNQTITGKGTLITANTNGIYSSTNTGQITVDVGTFHVTGTYGVLNASTSVINITCDYSIVDGTCLSMYNVTGTSNSGSFKSNRNHTDIGKGFGNTFLINPSSLVAGPKFFNFTIVAGVSLSSNEGVLCVSGIDSTYNINADINVSFDGSQGTPALNAVLVVYNTTGGYITIKGTNYIKSAGRHAIILNSISTVYDYCNSYQITGNTQEITNICGGSGYYTQYGKMVSFTHTSGINLGVGFTAAHATTDFATPTISAGGTDTLHFKGGLKCTYANNAAVGITVAGANPNLVVDGGTIEMVNSNTTNDAIHAGAATNMKALFVLLKLLHL